jgi:GntR family transcriptional regulator, rspAB operon transcriptional repressor
MLNCTRQTATAVPGDTGLRLSCSPVALMRHISNDKCGSRHPSGIGGRSMEELRQPEHTIGYRIALEEHYRLTIVETTKRPRPLKVQSAYDALKRLIVTLELPPGSNLNERELIERLETGRTPLREAILRLAHEGMVVHTPRRGARVSDLSLLDFQELIEARTHIEPLVAMLAASRANDRSLQQLEALLIDVETAAEAHDVERLVNRDLEFHTTIARSGGNRYFAALAEQVNTAALRFWYVSYIGIAGLPLSVDHHRLVFQALVDRDPQIARQRSLEHVEIFKQRMSKLVI